MTPDSTDISTARASLLRQLVENTEYLLPEKIFHITDSKNVESIRKEGLHIRYFGAVHGSMGLESAAKGRPSVFLSRHQDSNNLNTNLFEASVLTRVVVDFSKLDVEHLYPDDGIMAGLAQGQLFEDADDIEAELGVSPEEAELIDEMLDDDEYEPILIKSLWRWYLHEHGEVSYTKTIPPSAIVAVETVSL